MEHNIPTGFGASDAAKLNRLADWLDLQDKNNGTTNDEVQRDLRRIATNLSRIKEFCETFSWKIQ